MERETDRGGGGTAPGNERNPSYPRGGGGQRGFCRGNNRRGAAQPRPAHYNNNNNNNDNKSRPQSGGNFDDVRYSNIESNHQQSGRNDGGGGGHRTHYRRPHNIRPKTERPKTENGVETTSTSGQRHQPVSAKQKDVVKQTPKESTNSQGDTQRDVLIRRLKNNNCDCMICCEKITRYNPVWSCQVCYNLLHLKCVRSWAIKQASDSSGVWRCPACNAATTEVPKDYTCFCGKVPNPKPGSYSDCPHTCGQPCHKPCKTAQSKDENFTGHPCGMLCHPGPCGPCPAFVNRFCKCGRMSVPSQCAAQVGEMDCGQPCKQTLTCGRHQCEQGCHAPPCISCPITIPVSCHCGNTIKSISCDDYKDNEEENKFSCSGVCGKKLSCGNHFCSETCHAGECPTCPRLPSFVKTCPCGRMQLADHDPPFPERKSCEDPIPTCEAICKKKLPCGDGLEHFCPITCHDSECPPCTQSISVRCQCGRMTERFICSERPHPLTCVFRCNKKMSCKRHKCSNLCCTMSSDDANSHICAQPCNKMLSCGQHRCVQLCGHARDCPPCYNASFDELSCFCGNSILYPPIPCGAKPPPCDKPCSRPQVCSHAPNHNCHPDLPCPPCMVPVSCVCIGGHQKMMVPCSTPVETVSCGKLCDRRMPCGHRCTRVCHSDPCTTQKCRELCQRPRQSGCGHPCSQFCHEPNPCPPPETTACNFEVEYRCKCGLRSAKTQCPGSAAGLQALKITCDERCAIAERNRRMAEALQLTDVPLLPQAPITVYPAYVQEMVFRQPVFCLDVESALVDLVKGLSGQLPGTRNSYSFKPMVANSRRFIHELVPFYGCEAQAYDSEPNRNVVAYATSGKCYLPATSLQQSFPTAFVGISTRPNSPPTLRSSRVATQLPPAARSSNPQFEKVDSWRLPKPKSEPNGLGFAVSYPPLPSTSSGLPSNVPNLQPQFEVIQKAKRGKKQKEVSMFDDASDQPPSQVVVKTASSTIASSGDYNTTTLVTAAGPVRFALAPTLPSNSNLSTATVPDHWDDD